MNCAEARDYLDRFMDGELSSPQGKELTEHLEGCRECAAICAGEEKLRSELKEQLGSIRAPQGLRARLTGTTASASSGARPLRWTLAAAALFVAALVVFLFVPGVESPQALASEVAQRHEATRQGYCGEHRPDTVCVCPRCGHDAEKSLRGFFRQHVAHDPCLHDLSALGYEFLGAAVWNHRGKLICWTTQRDASGHTISHGLISTPVAIEGKSAILKVDGRTVLLLATGRPGMT